MNPAEFLLILGGALILGYVTDFVGKKTFLPRVTLLILLGIVVGRDGFDFVLPFLAEQFDLIANVTLLIIGFLLGGRFTLETLKKSGMKILFLSLCLTVIVSAVVISGLVLVGLDIEYAIILGCIASATAPAATFDTIRESNIKGPVSDLLLSVVAPVEAWSLVLFSLGIAVVNVLFAHQDLLTPILHASWEIGGGIVLGGILGLMTAYLASLTKPGKPMLSETVGMILVCGGLSMWLEVSFLLSSIAMGAVIVNYPGKSHEDPFEVIESVEWPFLVFFFIFAGAELEVGHLPEIGLTGLAFVLLRSAGKILGGAVWSRASGKEGKGLEWVGSAMLPQAGASMGMALVAASKFPQAADLLLSIIISTTVLFEIFGPICTQLFLRKVAAEPEEAG